MTVVMRRSRSARLLVKATSGWLAKRSTAVSCFFNRFHRRLLASDLATRPRWPLCRRGNGWKLSLTLGEEGAVAFEQRLGLVGGQGLVVALGDLVAGLEEEAFHALGPGVVVGIDDEGELAQQVSPAQGMVAA